MSAKIEYSEWTPTMKFRQKFRPGDTEAILQQLHCREVWEIPEMLDINNKPIWSMSRTRLDDDYKWMDVPFVETYSDDYEEPK